VIVTTSPLVLDQADRVVLVADGRAVAEGTHRELLRTRPDYRETVTRGESE
jgi:ABC-type multidrug transport system fused ATPase/permease subunit